MRTRLKYWRLRRNWTQDDLATKAKVSNQTIVNIERYGGIPRVGTVRKLVNALNIDPADFYTDDPEQADGKTDEEKPAA